MSCAIQDEAVPTDWGRLAYPYRCQLLAVKPTQLSKVMHNAGYVALNLPFEYSTVDTEDTAAAVSEIRRGAVRGCSLTIPHKERALALVDRCSPQAKTIGAINTIVNDGSSLHGFNTDWIGIIRALEEACTAGAKPAEVKTVCQRVLLLGAGGAARAALFALQELGAESVTVVNRSHERAEVIASQFGAAAKDFSAVKGALIGDFTLIINSTPLGSKLAESATTAYPFDLERLDQRSAVFDFVTGETPLTQAARKAGALTITGPRMLLYQAVEQFRLFTEQDAPVKAMEQALVTALNSP